MAHVQIKELSLKRLLYISNARIPTVMAHGLQIMQNCEAFADQGMEVTLWCARRKPLPELSQETQTNPWGYYGIKQNFHLRRLPCVDLTAWSPDTTSPAGKLLFFLQLVTFTLSVLIAALFTRADIYFSRDPLVLLTLSLIKPRERLAYEAHRLNQKGLGEWLQRLVLARVGATIAITPPLRDGLEKLQSTAKHKSRLMVAHDGIRKARFEGVPPQAEARETIGWNPSAFIVGYVGRLQTLGMDKGLNTVIEAIAHMPDPVSLALVGGPDDQAEVCRQHWLDRGLPESHFLYAGHVPAGEVPLYLSAFDVCVLPSPWTTQFAYYTSPIKLFEYMASGRALVASDLPSWADVVTHGENALLVPPSDITATTAALTHLQHDPQLRQRLAENAYAKVMQHYTWDARARNILNHINTTASV